MITRSIFKHAKNCHGSAKCDVFWFKRGTDTLIINYIIQMKTYFITNLIRSRSWVDLIIRRINGKHFDEVKPFLSLNYSALQEKFVHRSHEPNTVQSFL